MEDSYLGIVYTNPGPGMSDGSAAMEIWILNKLQYWLYQPQFANSADEDVFTIADLYGSNSLLKRKLLHFLSNSSGYKR